MLFRKIKGELKISTIKLLFKWYNSYYALNKVKGSGNLDVATGFFGLKKIFVFSKRSPYCRAFIVTAFF
ncbi:hypothetical protein [Helicobacter pylori]|uniref:hypothetical protein n=1 Tax=Helicobacter pylori TaxID=210 RepID=UPI0039DFA627